VRATTSRAHRLIPSPRHRDADRRARSRRRSNARLEFLVSRALANALARATRDRTGARARGEIAVEIPPRA